MRKIYKSIFAKILFIVLVLISVIGVHAYYEYEGSYRALIDINGTIKLDAFDVLYPSLRDINNKGYGITPENPYVIDSARRLQNLIFLNNSGRLKQSKKEGQKYYFCLQFDETELKQVLNLANQGKLSSIGNYEYPFEDELSGIVYGYNIPETDDIIFISGCVPKVEIEIKNTNEVWVDGVKDQTLNANNFDGDGTYLLLSNYYDESSCYEGGELNIDKVDLVGTTEQINNNEIEKKYVKLDSVTTVHQMIANAIIEADEEQVDVGFFSMIASTGYVHDLILYNTNVICQEEKKGNVFKKLLDLFNEPIVHFFDDEIGATDERHVGIFAGHIEGRASDISIGGESKISIKTKGVNYYSKYISVGYISDYATIGNTPLSELVADNYQTGGSAAGCLFADSIYTVVKQKDITPGKDGDTDGEASGEGANNYILKTIATDINHGWPGVSENNEFKYGSFSFLLSTADDTISEIWQNKSELYLLGEEGYNIYGSVLYCADEYRYSPEQQAGGSVIHTAASSKERKYAGISELKASGTVVDAGKYLIVAYADEKYYAVKIVATQGTDGIEYTFDNSEACDVTAFINDTKGKETLYQSALWEVEESSSEPEFKNSRFEDIYLKNTVSSLEMTNKAGKSKFKVNSNNNTIFIEKIEEVTDGDDGETYNVTNQYFLTFDSASKTFRMTGESELLNTTDTREIYMYRVTNGYTTRQVTSADDLEAEGDYFVIASNGTNYYSLGIKSDNDGYILNEFKNDYSFGSTVPSVLTVDQYENLYNNIWNIDSLSDNTLSLIDKASMTYHISRDGENLILTDRAASWNYATNNTAFRIYNGTNYINFAVNEEGTGFKIGNNNGYQIYLYRIIAQDDTPLNITYDSAKHVDAESTTLQAGDYLIVATYNGNDYALSTSSNTAISRQSINVNNLSTITDTNYKNSQWRLDVQDSKLKIYNVGRSDTTTKRYLNVGGTNGTTLNVNTSTNINWMYDATSFTFYYKNGTTTYYLTCNGTNFSITDTKPSVLIKVYKCETLTTFTNLKRATVRVDGTTNYDIAGYMDTEGYYLISYSDLSEPDSSQYILSASSISNPSLSKIELSNRYTLSSDTIPTTSQTGNGVTLTTILDLGLGTWKLERFEGSYSGVSNSRYFRSWQFSTDSTTKVYIGLNSQSNNRVIVASSTAANPGDDICTKFILGSTSSGNGNGGYPFFNYMGTGRYYTMVKDTVEGTFTTLRNNSYSYNNNYQTMVHLQNDMTAADVPYVYYATEKSTSKLCNLISSDGDVLEREIHYMFAAEKDGVYYAMSREVKEDGSIYFGGINVTSTLAGEGGIINKTKVEGSYNYTTNVPRTADWTQYSDDYNLIFYHTDTSTLSSRNFLDVDNNGNMILRKISSQSNCDAQQFHYDIINKTLTCVIDSTTYYVKYNQADNNFSLTTNESEKATLHMIRYSPTYKVERVTDYTDLNNDPTMLDGEFIIAAHDANGYTGFGLEGSTLKLNENITNYLTSELSEADYNAHLINYLFKQVYYDYAYSTDEAKEEAYFNSVKNNKYIVFQTLLKNGNGSIGISKSALEAYSSAYEWRIVKQSNGTWKFTNNVGYGDNNANSKGITYTPSTISASLTIKDPNKEIGSYLGDYYSNVSFANGTSNIYFYNLNGTVATTINTSNQYLIVGTDKGRTFAIGNDNGTVILTMFDTDSLSDITSDTKYKWSLASSEDGYTASNNGQYAYIENNEIKVHSSNVGYFVKASNNTISYITRNNYIPYRSGNSSLGAFTANTYSAKVYSYNRKNNENYSNQNRVYDYTFTLVQPNATGDKVLIVKNNNTYYIANLNGTNITCTSISPTVNGTTLTLTNVRALTINNLNVSKTGDYYQIYTTQNGTNRYLSLSDNHQSFTLSNTLTNNKLYYDGTTLYAVVTNEYVASIQYNSGFETATGYDGNNNGIMALLYKVSGSTFTKLTEKDTLVANSTYVLFVKASDNKYYLLDYDSTNDVITTKLIGNQISTTNIPTSAYLVCGNSPSTGYGNQLQFGSTRRYLTMANGVIVPGAANTTYWEFAYDKVYTDQSRLFTVVQSAATPSNLKVVGSRVGTATSGTNTYFYNYRVENAGTVNEKYYLNGLLKATPTLNTQYVIVIFENGCYYIVDVDDEGNVKAVPYGSGLPSGEINKSMLFKWVNCPKDSSIKSLQHEDFVIDDNPENDVTYYLRKDESSYLSLSTDSGNCAWSYSYSEGKTINGEFSTTSPSAGQTSSLDIFKVSKNDKLDSASDTKTTLVGKSRIKSSLSILESTNYVIAVKYEGKVYTLSMKDPNTIKTLDITDTYNEATNGTGKTIRLYDASVWNQIGSDYSLIFNSNGFAYTGEGFYLLAGDNAYLNDGKPTAHNIVIEEEDSGEEDSTPTTHEYNASTLDSVIEEINTNKSDTEKIKKEDFIWNVYTYGDNGSEYVLGNYDEESKTTNYLYFDTKELEFRITGEYNTAKTPNNKVQIYQLGADQQGSIIFQTFEIALLEDGVTIGSYPLNVSEAKDIKKFNNDISADDLEGTISALIEGEYMIAAKVNENYYALTLNSSGQIAFSDISLLFSGNFILDGAGNYCVSINQEYLWKQTKEPSYNEETGIVSGLEFLNFDKGRNLNFNNSTSFSFDGKQLKSSNGYYLNFDTENGFTLSENESDVDIIIYTIGTGGAAAGGVEEDTQYSYYSYGLNTNMLDYSNFAYQKYLIKDLPSYEMSNEGKLEKVTGWALNTVKNLEEVNSSIYFKAGVNYSNDASAFVNEFEEIDFTYSEVDPNSELILEKETTYYAPTGMMSFAITEASNDNPVFINVIVTTEMDSSFADSDTLRYLSMWKIAEFDVENGVFKTLYGDSEDKNTDLDYAQTLIKKFYTPDAAIPLPNHLVKNSSLVRVMDDIEQDADGQNLPATYTNYHLTDDANWDHLIAHTFTVSSPGVYYLGSTYGTVTYCYVTVDNLLHPEEGEDTSSVISDKFTIDFVFGEIGTDGEFGDEEALGTISYIGRDGGDDLNLTWVHSNIAPEFTNGTRGLYDDDEETPIGEMADPYNPTDEIDVEIRREILFNDANDVYISTVYVDVDTLERIDAEGKGIMYVNSNTIYERPTRKIIFNISCHDEELDTGGDDPIDSNGTN